MNIRFGKAIELDNYVDELLSTEGDIYDKERVDRFIDTKRKVLTNTMMRRVYSQMQIHFDHIFILSLVTMPTVKVCPSYLKTLIYKNVRSLRLFEDYNLHSELQEELFKLILDDNYEPFRSAIEIAREQQIRAPSKEEKGAPIVLFDASYETGLVFSHGYMAAPKEIRTLAEYLFSKGINVYVPRLRGHGTDPEALKNVSAQDWDTDFERAFTAMRQVCNKVFIGGFSMGGLLALDHAAQHKVDGVIALNSALKLHDLRVSYVVPTLHFFNEMIAYLNAEGIKEWIDNSHTENPSVNYLKHPLASVAQMEKLMSKVQGVLKNITAPILIIQGDNDPIVKRESARLIYDRIKSKDKKFLLLPREKHGILADEGHTEVFEAINNFIIHTPK